MAKRYIYVEGVLSWVKHIKPDTTFGDPKWSLVIHPYPDSLKLIKEELLVAKGDVLAIMNKLTTDEEGDKISFSRFCSKVYSGKLITFEPPRVLNPDGSPLGRDISIGNGSTGKVCLEHYTWPKAGGKRGSAVRWESLQLTNFIPYEPKKDLSPEEYRKVKGLVEQPTQLF